jgi:pyruvate/2-oxoglutarate dehydrogenase complex dihydrolipoamide dehydrogenase (E3) component/uncharacterized membrane protein YdjX (TVP38/TMEM64 family)
MKNFHYDVIVVWAWSGGLTVSIWLASAWKKVALIEKWLIGWDCTNYWCVPSKAFIDIAKSWKYSNLKDALKEVRVRRKKIQDEETWDKIEQYWMKVISWKAVFSNKNTLVVDGKEKVTASQIIISTGSHPMMHDIEWLQEKYVLTNKSVFELDENIKNLVVVWWGYIWCELAESFANLWVKVTIIQRNVRLIPREEENASEILEKVFREKWIKIFTSSNILGVEWKKIIIRDTDLEENKEIVFDKVLVALWRWPNIDGLGLEKIGVKHDKRWVFVNKFNRTNIKNIYAIWDCVHSNPQFTHWANNEWRGVIRNILFSFIKSNVRKLVVPSVLYTNLEVARAWKTEKELISLYGTWGIVTEVIHFHENDRSKLTKDEIGFIKINFKRLTGKVLWATIMCTRAWDMLPALVLAMQNDFSAYKLAKLIYPYPTKSDLIKRVADKFVVGTIRNIKGEIGYFLKANMLQIITAIIWFCLLFSFFTYKHLNYLSFEQIALDVYNFIWWHMFIGPFIYIFLYAVRPIVLFPATFMTFMSWALFWFWWGLIFTLVWENMSASFAYLLGRIFWKKMIWKGSSIWIIDDLKNKANESPFMAILMVRLLFFPFDLVNYVSGFLKINFKGFFFATLIWIIPWVSVFVLAWSAFHSEKIESFSAALKNIDITLLYFAALLLVLSILFAKLVKKLRGSR